MGTEQGHTTLGEPGPGLAWGNLPEVDHYTIFYGMVTRALGIDMTICRAMGLDLMVSLEQPPCVGLMKPEVCQKLAVQISTNAQEPKEVRIRQFVL